MTRGDVEGGDAARAAVVRLATCRQQRKHGCVAPPPNRNQKRGLPAEVRDLRQVHAASERGPNHFGLRLQQSVDEKPFRIKRHDIRWNR